MVNSEVKVEYSITEKQCNDIKESLSTLYRKSPRIKLTTILSGIANGSFEARHGKKTYKKLLFMDEFRHDMLTVDEEAELLKKLLESERMRKHFHHELETVRDEVPCLKKVDEDKLSTTRNEGLSSINFKEMVNSSKTSLAYPVIDFLMTKPGIKVDTEEEKKKRKRNVRLDDTRFAMVLSMACYNRNTQSSGVQKALGRYFRDSGVKDTELEMLYQMGVSASVSSLNLLRKSSEEAGQKRVREIASSEAPVEQMETVEQAEMEAVEQAEGATQTSRSAPNDIAVESINMPPNDLASEIGEHEAVEPDESTAHPKNTIDSPRSNKVRTSPTI